MHHLLSGNIILTLSMKKKIIVIGAGVIGATSALALQRDGHEVLLIDRDAPCSGASFGNAGGIVNGSCVPTAMPGILKNVMGMIGQPLSPLSIRPAYLHKISPWLMRFIWQSRLSTVQQNAIYLQSLSHDAVASWKKLTANTPLSCLLRDTGWLKVYESDNAFNNTRNALNLHDQVGSAYEILSAGQIKDLEPNLAPIFKHGFYQKDSISVTDPEKLVLGLVDLFTKNGGSYKQFPVSEITTNEHSVTLKGSSGYLTADKVVLAAGAWSKSLAKQLGDIVPLDTERGYHLMFPESTGSLLKRPVLNGENSFVLAPMNKGMRMTSQVEFAGLIAKPNYSRVRSLIPCAKRMLPKIDTHEESVWMGCRPSLPDSLPVIGFSQQSNHVLYAFGHQHLGMTLGATTAYIVSDLLGNREANISIFPYQATRF